MRRLCAWAMCIAFAAVSISLTSCDDEPSIAQKIGSAHAGELSDIECRQIISDMGFREDMIERQGDGFLVERDIFFTREELLRYRQERHDCSKCDEFSQYHTNNVVSRANVRDMTVFVDATIPVGGPDDWRSAIQQAISDWNSVRNCIVNFRYVTTGPADITVSDDGNNLLFSVLAVASFPSGGQPGPTVDINLDYNNNQNLSFSQKRLTMVHELGHCIGLRHTNWSALGEPDAPFGAVNIYGTPGLSGDNSSVMNGQIAGDPWSGFSEFDETAVQMLYWDYWVPGVSWEAQGAGVDLAKINVNLQPDIVFMGFNNPPGTNDFHYVIGWDPDSRGVASSYSQTHIVSGMSDESQGADISIGDLGSIGDPDIVFMNYHNPPGPNVFHYKIGWDIQPNGVPMIYSPVHTISGVGSEAQGAGVAIAQINSHPDPELIFVANEYINGGFNEFRYKIAWDIQSNGIPMVISPTIVASGLQFEAQGAAATVADVGGTSRPDLILMAMDNPSGSNILQYVIGYDLNTSGVVSSWSSVHTRTVPYEEGQGAGVAVGNILGSSAPEILLMGYDYPDYGNQFKYMVGIDMAGTGLTSGWYE